MANATTETKKLYPNDQSPDHPAYTYVLNRTLHQISSRWKMQILFSIREGLRQFSLLKLQYPILSDQLLAKKLKELEADGLIVRSIQEGRNPTRTGYLVTEKAISLLEIMVQLTEWGRKYK